MRVSFEDDGDEAVTISVDGIDVYRVDHDEHGWDGMSGALGAVTAVVEALGQQVDNRQGIV